MFPENYGFKIEVDTLACFGRDVPYRSLILNSVLTVMFIELDELESSLLEGEQLPTLAELPAGVLVLPGLQPYVRHVPVRHKGVRGDAGLRTHAFLVPREQHQFFLGELNALDLMTRPDDFGIEDVDRLSVVEFVFQYVVNAEILDAYQLKRLVIK